MALAEKSSTLIQSCCDPRPGRATLFVVEVNQPAYPPDKGVFERIADAVRQDDRPKLLNKGNFFFKRHLLGDAGEALNIKGICLSGFTGPAQGRGLCRG